MKWLFTVAFCLSFVGTAVSFERHLPVSIAGSNSCPCGCGQECDCNGDCLQTVQAPNPYNVVTVGQAYTLTSLKPGYTLLPPNYGNYLILPTGLQPGRYDVSFSIAQAAKPSIPAKDDVQLDPASVAAGWTYCGAGKCRHKDGWEYDLKTKTMTCSTTGACASGSCSTQATSACSSGSCGTSGRGLFRRRR